MDIDKKLDDRFAKFEKKMHQMILEAIDAVLVGIENMGYAKQEDLLKVQKEVRQVKDTQSMNHKELKDDIQSLEAELAKTATRAEVEVIRRKVN